MLRLFRWFIPVCCVLALAACGGGGGGGPVPERPLISNETMTLERAMAGLEKGPIVDEDLGNASDFAKNNLGSTVAAGPNGGLAAHSLDLVNTEGDILLSLETGPDGVVHLYGDKYLAGGRTFEKTPEDQAEAAKLTPVSDWYDAPGPINDIVDERNPDVKFDGTVAFTEFNAALNADAASGGVPLTYASFGFWEVNVNYDGKLLLPDGSTRPIIVNNVFYEPIYTKSLSNTDLPQAVTYTGNATAMAHAEFDAPTDTGEHTPDKFTHVDGTVALTVNGGLDSGDLALTFPGFYNIAYNNITINPVSGAIGIAYGNAPVLTENGVNSTGVVIDGANLELDDADSHYLRGQFYGPGSGATDVVGAFSLEDMTGKGVKGSFGAVAP